MHRGPWGSVVRLPTNATDKRAIDAPCVPVSLRLVISVVATFALACGSKSDTPSASPSNVSAPSPASFAFRAPPIPPSAIEFIAPLGNLNPPDHTLPTDHIYLYHRLNNPSAPARTVAAPADGTIQTIISHNNDVKLLIKSASTFMYYLDHVVPDASVRQGMTVTAGQTLGTTGTGSFGIDLGLINDAITVPLLAPGRYSAESLHGEAPLKYFDEPLRSQLYALVRRSGDDRDGTFNYDAAGRLSGNWFAEGLAASESSLPSAWSKHLSFAYDNYEPASIRIASGGALGVVGAFGVPPGSVPPREVSPSSGKVVYRLFQAAGTSTFGSQVGILLVQMSAPDRVQVEYVAGAGVTDAPFSSSARIYVR
jgi:hypothetical protein